MIFEKLIEMLLSPIKWLLETVPPIDITFDPSGIYSLVGVMAAVNCIVPVDAVFKALVMWFLLANFDFPYQIIMWIVRKIPGVD